VKASSDGLKTSSSPGKWNNDVLILKRSWPVTENKLNILLQSLHNVEHDSSILKQDVLTMLETQFMAIH
jgi:hypothetical protein